MFSCWVSVSTVVNTNIQVRLQAVCASFGRFSEQFGPQNLYWKIHYQKSVWNLAFAKRNPNHAVHVL